MNYVTPALPSRLPGFVDNTDPNREQDGPSEGPLGYVVVYDITGQQLGQHEYANGEDFEATLGTMDRGQGPLVLGPLVRATDGVTPGARVRVGLYDYAGRLVAATDVTADEPGQEDVEKADPLIDKILDFLVQEGQPAHLGEIVRAVRQPGPNGPEWDVTTLLQRVAEISVKMTRAAEGRDHVLVAERAERDSDEDGWNFCGLVRAVPADVFDRLDAGDAQLVDAIVRAATGEVLKSHEVLHVTLFDPNGVRVGLREIDQWATGDLADDDKAVQA